jgi:hypothetical protein
VYSNAHIVSAANHAKDSSVGCLHTRQFRPDATITISGFSGNGGNETSVRATLLFPGDEYGGRAGEFNNEPLFRRGWVLQERVLAKRAIHYNTRKMYFECHRGIISEDGHRIEQRLCPLHGPKQSLLEKTDRDTWNYLLWAYGDRRLT